MIFQQRSVLTLAMMAALISLTGCNKKTESTDDSAAVTTQQTDVTTTTPTTAAGESDALTAEQKLVNGFSNIAQAAYEDALMQAKQLDSAINDFISNPTQANLDKAKQAYKEARRPYSQTEVFRFDEGFVGADANRAIDSVDSWEGQVNAWPLDEALIDYVSNTYQGEYNDSRNIINSDYVQVGGTKTDTTNITPELLKDMNELGGSEANVTTGYHAIEFLLWGQDTNGVNVGSGNRPVSDYYAQESQGECTNGDTVAESHTSCVRRGQYLQAASQLLVNDLEDMVAQWQPNDEHNLRHDLMSRADDNAVQQIMYQMGSLSLGELASERMQVAFVTGSTEDEHECFSDLTHNSYANNAQGIRNIYDGYYVNSAGEQVGEYGLQQYLKDSGQPEAAGSLQSAFNKVTASFDEIVNQAENNDIKVDQMIATPGQVADYGISSEEQEKRRNYVKTSIDSLKNLTTQIEMAAANIGIDSLDADAGSQF